MDFRGYLAGKTDQEHCATEERREYPEVDELRDSEIKETEDIVRPYDLKSTLKKQDYALRNSPSFTTVSYRHSSSPRQTRNVCLVP